MGDGYFLEYFMHNMKAFPKIEHPMEIKKSSKRDHSGFRNRRYFRLYRVDRGSLSVNEKEAKTVKMIFDI